MIKYNVFPFTALLGQEGLKLGLILNAINPAIGGILIRGEKGTAKSTAVRGLAALLPDIEVVEDCRFSCDPQLPGEFCSDCQKKTSPLTTGLKKVQLVNLPLNATEDRITGGIDFSRAIQKGKTVLQPGLLAEAHRSILYIDEVNLLDDHIVDLILGSASSGINHVEREGISFSHPAKISLIGTMNPEEGELRPQLLDRFGLCIEVTASQELDERIELLLRRESYDQNAVAFLQEFADDSHKLQKRIVKAKELLARVHLAPHMRTFISELCATNNVAGHRADLVMEQAARALAAWEGSEKVKTTHIARISPMVLLHRLRDSEPPPPPPPPPQDEQEEVQSHEEEKQEETTSKNEHNHEEPAETSKSQEEESNKSEENTEQDDAPQSDDDSHGGGDMVFDIGEPFKVKKITAEKDRIARRGSGRRSRSRISQKQGRYIKSGQSNANNQNDIALDATIRAAAPFQKMRAEKKNGSASSLAVHLTSSDIRVKIREKRIGNFLLFVVDGSGSMGARGRMTASKSAIMSLLLDAYQKRDKVGMVSFRRNDAHVNLPITSSVELAGRLLAEMPVGGRTPLSAGLVKSYETISNYLIREPSGKPIVLILTDGKTNVSMGDEKPVDEMVRVAKAMAHESRTKYIVVDTEEDGLVTFDLAKQLAGCLGGEYFKTQDLQAEELVKIVREQQ